MFLTATSELLIGMYDIDSNIWKENRNTEDCIDRLHSYAFLLLQLSTKFQRRWVSTCTQNRQ